MGPQALMCSKAFLSSPNKLFSGNTKRNSTKARQQIPPIYPAAHAVPENLPNLVFSLNLTN